MRCIRAIAPFLLLGFIGCGTDEDRIKIVPVTGTVTKNGKPMADATITFVPDASNKDSTPGVDSTGPEGNYKLMWRNRSGVAPGKYRVAVQPPIAAPTGPTHSEFANDPYMAQVGAEAAGGRTGAPKKEAPGEKSEFDAEVSDKGDILDFDVKSSSKK
jgi:hypothetical protein